MTSAFDFPSDGATLEGGVRKHIPPTMVLYCGQSQTFVCRAGEVQPIPLPLPPVNPGGLSMFFHRLGGGGSAGGAGLSISSSSSLPPPPSAPPQSSMISTATTAMAMSTTTGASIGKTPFMDENHREKSSIIHSGKSNNAWTSLSPSSTLSSSTSTRSTDASPLAPVLSLARQLYRYIAGKNVVVIVPVSFSSHSNSSFSSSSKGARTSASTTSRTTCAASATSPSPPSFHYLDHLMLFLTHPLVSASSLVVISDMTAIAVAGGCTGGSLILHGGRQCCSIGYVVDGCTKRFSTCRWGDLFSEDKDEGWEDGWWEGVSAGVLALEKKEKKDNQDKNKNEGKGRGEEGCASNVHGGGETGDVLTSLEMDTKSSGTLSSWMTSTTLNDNISNTDSPELIPTPSSTSFSVAPSWKSKLVSFFGVKAVQRVVGSEEGEVDRKAFGDGSGSTGSSSFSSSLSPCSSTTTTFPLPTTSMSMTSTNHVATTPTGKLPLLLSLVYQSHLPHDVVIVVDALGKKGMIVLSCLHAIIEEITPAMIPSIIKASKAPSPLSHTPSSTCRNPSPQCTEERHHSKKNGGGGEKERTKEKRNDAKNISPGRKRSRLNNLSEDALQERKRTAASFSHKKVSHLECTQASKREIAPSSTEVEESEGGEEEQEEESGESSSNGTTTTTSSSSSSEEEEEEDDATSFSSSTSVTSWNILPTCPPCAPWWMPVIGGSILAELPERDLRGMRILPSEVKETNGKIVYWKALL